MSDEKAEEIRQELAAAGISSATSDLDFVPTKVSAAAASCKTNVRVEWNRMTAANKKSFIDAIVCLTKKPSRGVTPTDGTYTPTLWDDLYWTHSIQVNGVHSVDTFLPFHRYFVHVFDKLLRSECGYTAPLPWWRETDAAGKVKSTNLFTSSYFGTLPARTSIAGSCISDGPFKGLKGTFGCVARGENATVTARVTKARENECHGNATTTYRQHRICVESTNHSDMHIGIGPTMADVALSPADPIFWMHHSYIDYQWKRWQNVASSRSTSIEGCYNPGYGSGAPCLALELDHPLGVDGIVPDMTVGDILNTENNILCYTYDDLL
ncbi:uncharacterized protein B0I36DRAFT_402775 [Microdochium trichocladiopsis]|uniref:Tyrosinase copper-binding domain-containing protein n=1 Tax=Microdochium trichocladiopsis TaxID=1682393 RepID=A0A9P8YAV5_9PEZI|nr:uncharacterized protein B0I36DRAFT_402775 [Microdochium trichocladiopsis]KAH7037276.1 hypothetical protein B0I36DRAFT_402775 [Microdochium trichocladiopsis]